MISITYECGLRRISGKNVTRAESWNGIGDYWTGYTALLTDIAYGEMLVVSSGNKEFDREIDYHLFSELNETSRDVLCFHYGLQARSKHDLSGTAKCMNQLSFGGMHYTEKMVLDILNEALIKLNQCQEIREYISGRTDGKCFGAAQ